MTTPISRILVPVIAVTVLCNTARTQGLLIHDASTGDVLGISSSHVAADIRDQVAMVTSTQRFINTSADTLGVKYAYPLPSAASATRVRWMWPDSIWHIASMVTQPQDTTLPGVGGGGGGTVSADLEAYLGETPLYFNMSDPVPPGGWIMVELCYVELLPYANARVEFPLGSDYSPLVNTPLPEVSIDIMVRSQRAILGMDITGSGSWTPAADALFLSSDSAHLQVDDANVPASGGVLIGYDLDPLAYGLTCMSNYLPDSLVKCDALDNGFFVLLIEPEPTTEVVEKDFVIVIDKSGSMSGTKIEEAKDAAAFMVNNLNAGDAFNVIAFSSTNYPWSSGLQPYTPANMQAALTWIDQIGANGGTNINDAVTLGIQNFTGSDPGNARSMVFLTDGQDSNPDILSNALQLRQSIAPDLQIFTFGIGSGYNEQLLNQLAVQNNGVSQFLETANFSQVMSDFYTQIQNPVLLSPTATFDQPDIQDLYPLPLLGLFVGQQMVIVGRYDVPGEAELHLDGFASGNPVAFDFTLELTDSFDEDKLFVTKIWAQKAVDALVNEYYAEDPGSNEATILRDSVVHYSMCYGIGSPFTSFADGGGTSPVGLEEEEDAIASSTVPVFPEPSFAGSPVVFDLSDVTRTGRVMLRIFDALGRLVVEVDITDRCGTQWTWNGTDDRGADVKGTLVYQINDGTTLRTGHLTRL